MRIFKHICVFLCLSVLYIGCFNTGSTNRGTTNRVEANPEQIVLADSILWYFQQEQFDKIVRHFDDNMKQQLNKEQLAVAWAQLNTQFGKYTKSEFYRAEKLDMAGDSIVYLCHFVSQKLYFQLVLGNGNQVIGLYFKPKSN